MPIDKTTAGGKFFNMSFFNYLFSYALSSVSMFQAYSKPSLSLLAKISITFIITVSLWKHLANLAD